MSKGQQTISVLADKYSLIEGKGDDYYQCHSTWCLTKSGAEKIRIAEEIKHSFPTPVVTDNSVAYMATFTAKDGTEVHEVGSCRWDGQANNPARTHSHEMAFKRLKVRGILAIVAPAGQVYGIDELTDEYKQYGNQANTMPAQPQPQPQAQAGVQQNYAQPQAQAQNAPQNAPMQASAQGGFVPPPQGTKGWINGGEKLPSDWNSLMGKFAELTGLDRAKFERKIYDTATKWEGPNGLYLPSAKFATFGEYALAHKVWNDEVKYNAYGALQALNRARDIEANLSLNGSVEISESNGMGGLQSCMLYTKQNNPDFQATAGAQQIANEFGGEVASADPLSDVPF